MAFQVALEDRYYKVYLRSDSSVYSCVVREPIRKKTQETVSSFLK